MDNNMAIEKNAVKEQSRIVIREYVQSLFPQLYRLLSDIYDSNITQFDLESNYCSQDRQIILAIQDNEVVGCAFLSYSKDFIRERKIVFVSYVAVDNAHRHQGIGAKMFDEIERRARDRACAAIELTSADYRTAAHAFYYSLNFTKKKTTVFIKEL